MIMINRMKKNKIIYTVFCTGMLLVFTACKSLQIVQKVENKNVPEAYALTKDSTNSATIKWKDFFQDKYLDTLIEIALNNNQELAIFNQELEVLKNEIGAKKGEYLPFVEGNVDAGVDKVGRYTSQGANDANTDIKPGIATPEFLPNYSLGLSSSWEIDVWKKLRNAKESAVHKYLASAEGKNFLVTNLVSEIAENYYELLALDNQLDLLNQTIELQTNALEIVKKQKESARVTELAVKRFEAQLLNSKGLQFEIQQRIVVSENRINFLLGRFPQKVSRNSENFNRLVPKQIQEGIPSQLLSNRTDIRQAEEELTASKLDVKVARAKFYPSFVVRAGMGFDAFNMRYLISTPQSLALSMAGNLVAPLVNRKALKAEYYNANARQIQAVYTYEKSILNAYIEVTNELSNINNLSNQVQLKTLQVEALNSSVSISTDLFGSARADYMEVLLTQRDALDARFELIELKKEQLIAVVRTYKYLGGGWN